MQNTRTKKFCPGFNHPCSPFSFSPDSQLESKSKRSTDSQLSSPDSPSSTHTNNRISCWIHISSYLSALRVCSAVSFPVATGPLTRLIYNQSWLIDETGKYQANHGKNVVDLTGLSRGMRQCVWMSLRMAGWSVALIL